EIRVRQVRKNSSRKQGKHAQNDGRRPGKATAGKVENRRKTQDKASQDKHEINLRTGQFFHNLAGPQKQHGINQDEQEKLHAATSVSSFESMCATPTPKLRRPYCLQVKAWACASC